MKQKTIFSFLVVAFILQGLTVDLSAQKSILLRYNLIEGDKFNYNMDLDQDIVFETNGQTMALDQIMTFEMTQNVLKVTADSIKLSGKISRVKMTQGILGMKIEYDSDDPSTSQNPMTAKIAEELGKTIDKPFTMNMDYRGNMGEMDLSKVTSNDDFAKNLNSGSQYIVYPEKKVSIGESWSTEIIPFEESDMIFSAKYTLLAISGKTATIAIDAKISANNLQDADVRIDGTQKGEIKVDIKTGWVIESKIDQELELDIEQNGMKFPATVSGSIITTSKKAN